MLANIYNYAILITLLYTFLPFIEGIVDFIGWTMIGSINFIGRLIYMIFDVVIKIILGIYFTTMGIFCLVEITEPINTLGSVFIAFVKHVIKWCLHCLMAIIYIYWLILIANILSNLIDSQNLTYNITFEKQNEIIDKMYNEIYKNYPYE